MTWLTPWFKLYFHQLRHFHRSTTMSRGILILKRLYIPYKYTHLQCYDCGKLFFSRMDTDEGDGEH